MAKTTTEIAHRWVEPFSAELGGAPVTLPSLVDPIEVAAPSLSTSSLPPPPTLDELLDVLLDSSRGRALGLDAVPIEVVQMEDFLQPILWIP